MSQYVNWGKVLNYYQLHTNIYQVRILLEAKIHDEDED